MTRLISLSMLVLIGLVSIAWNLAEAPAFAEASAGQAAKAETPPTLDPANFTGKVTPHTTTDFRVTRYTFDPGARTNWHSHEGGQVIIIEKGRMRVFERGGTAKEFAPRETYIVASGVTHWHGAQPNEPLTQVAISYGTTTWMSPVTDSEYAAAARK